MIDQYVNYYQNIMVTGSRSLQVANYDYTHKVLDNVVNIFQRLKNHNPNVILRTGMAEGFDACAAMAAIKTDIRYIACIPSPSYGDYYWTRNSLTGQDRTKDFEYYLNNAYDVVYVCKSHEWGKANFKRNTFMVERSEFALVYNRNSRGTAHAVKELDKHLVPHYDIYPDIS